MYVNGIVWLLTLPAIIIVSYLLINIMLKKFEKKHGNKEK